MNVRKSIPNRSVHAYHKIYVVWGRKPEAKEKILSKTPDETLSEIDTASSVNSEPVESVK